MDMICTGKNILNLIFTVTLIQPYTLRPVDAQLMKRGSRQMDTIRTGKIVLN
jgi:hypothetical protein